MNGYIHKTDPGSGALAHVVVCVLYILHARGPAFEPLLSLFFSFFFVVLVFFVFLLK